MRHVFAALVLAWAAFCFSGPAGAVTDEVIMIPLETAAGPALVPVWVVYPDGYDATKPTVALLAFPPGAQDLSMVDANFNWFVPEAMKRNWLVIGPTAPEGRGFARLGRDLIGPLLDELLKRFPVADGKFHLGGQSNGGNSAFAAALDFPERFRSITVLAGAPPDAAENDNVGRLKGMPVNMFVGEYDDGYLPRMTATREALRAAGVWTNFTIVPGSGHVLNDLRGRNAQFIFAGME